MSKEDSLYGAQRNKFCIILHHFLNEKEKVDDR